MKKSTRTRLARFERAIRDEEATRIAFANCAKDQEHLKSEAHETCLHKYKQVSVNATLARADLVTLLEHHERLAGVTG